MEVSGNPILLYIQEKTYLCSQAFEKIIVSKFAPGDIPQTSSEQQLYHIQIHLPFEKTLLLLHELLLICFIAHTDHLLRYNSCR